jgi:hypothetical protein
MYGIPENRNTQESVNKAQDFNGSTNFMRSPNSESQQR